jgi:hypothetical protein
MSEVILNDHGTLEIIKGQDYINWRFKFADEILVHVKNMGKVLLAKLPDGKLQATQNQGIIDSFTKVNPELTRYGRVKNDSTQ